MLPAVVPLMGVRDKQRVSAWLAYRKEVSVTHIRRHLRAPHAPEHNGRWQTILHCNMSTTRASSWLRAFLTTVGQEYGIQPQIIRATA